MINKSDIILLLTKLSEEKNIDVKEDIIKLYKSQSIPVDILQKINDNRPLDLLSFYEKIRKSYNNNKSKLYINIMKSTENLIEDPNTVLTTLTGLLNQIFQFKCEDLKMFYNHARADEICKVINIYLTTNNINPAFQLLSLIKSDIKCLEYIKNNAKNIE